MEEYIQIGYILGTMKANLKMLAMFLMAISAYLI